MALLPLFDISHLPDAAWVVDPPAPSGLLVGTTTLVSAEDAMHSLADFIGDAVEVGYLEPPPHQDWLAQVLVPGLSTPLLFFAIQRDPEDGLGIPVSDCGFLLGVEGLLHPSDPLTVYVNQTRLLAAAAGQTEFAWDVVTNRVLAGEGLTEAFLGEGVEPPDRVLWVTEALETSPDSWRVQTRGLHRCGRAEIAVPNVPSAMHQQALLLVDGVASLCLEQPLPAPGQVIQIGTGLDVQLRTAEDMELSDHVEGPVAFLVDRDARDAARTLEIMCSSEFSMYRSTRSMSRETKQARTTWDAFVDICQRCCKSVDCLVQVPFIPPDGTEEDTNHLWMKVVETGPAVVTAELLHAPDEAGLTIGDRHEVNADMVSSWCVMMEAGPMGPDTIQELKRQLELT